MQPFAPAAAIPDLTALNTLALQAGARALVAVTDEQQVPLLDEAAPDVFVLGGGSNVILPRRLEGTVALMRLKGIRRLADEDGDVVVEAAAGENWHDFVEHCVAAGWGGLENLALIPGTVGAAPVQNIGAYGLEIRERIQAVVAYDRVQKVWTTFTPADCGFAYRDSVFKRNPGRWIITAVRLRLPRHWEPRLGYPDLRERPEWRGAPATAQAVFRAVCEIRRAKLPDPAQLPNAGSFFKNPVVPAPLAQRLLQDWPDMPHWPAPGGASKLAAAWLIERAGWKGCRLGPVGMHERHALVLVNHGGANAGDVLALARAVAQDVRARFGVTLEIEPVQPVPG